LDIKFSDERESIRYMQKYYKKYRKSRVTYSCNKEGHVVSLTINYSRKYFPDEIFKLPYLRKLNFSNNWIVEIPNLKKLSNLIHLDMSGNKIERIDGLDDITELEDLNLSKNNIMKIEGIEHLSKLKRLDLSSNKITKIKGIENLSKLTTLTLSYNKIDKIENLENLTQLEQLYLHNNQIKKIENLDNLTKLQRLTLYNNPLPKSELKLINKEPEVLIRKLIFNKFLENNLSRTLQRKYKLELNDFGVNREGKIIEINLSDKGLKVLPEILYELPELQILNISKNKIKEMSGFEKLPNLKILDLSYNKIKEIKGLESLILLEELYLQGNHISKLEGLGNLSKLRLLIIRKNQVTEFENKHINTLEKDNPIRFADLKLLVESGVQEVVEHCRVLESRDRLAIRNLQKQFVLSPEEFYINEEGHLTEVDLTNRHLKKIPDSLQNFTHLQELNLSNNEITIITGLAQLTELKKLNLSDNKIEKIEGLDTLLQLKTLNLHDNKIKIIEGLENLSNLQELTLQNNEISKLEGIETLTQLQILNLKNNPLSERDAKVMRKVYATGARSAVNYCRKIELESKREVSSRFDKIKKMISVSSELTFDTMRKTLGMDEGTFLSNIFYWAEEFNFQIEEDVVIINEDSVGDFINMLETKFEQWEDTEKSKEGKI